MMTKELGHTGVSIPEIGLGTWNYHGGVGPLRKGLEAGALFIDTAESYGSEEVVGAAIKGMRDRVFLATKVSPTHSRYADVLLAADRSLERLATDTIDLYQLHCPNYFVPIAETLAAMEKLVEAGKVRFIGVSNFSVAGLERAQRAMQRYRIVSNQVRYNLTDRSIERRLLPFCRVNHITVIAYSPLSRHPSRILGADGKGVLAELARETGRTPAQIALNWCLREDRVVAIPKASSEAHAVENCGASGWRLTAEQVRKLDENIRFRRRTHLETLARFYGPSSLRNLIRRLVS